MIVLTYEAMAVWLILGVYLLGNVYIIRFMDVDVDVYRNELFRLQVESIENAGPWLTKSSADVVKGLAILHALFFEAGSGTYRLRDGGDELHMRLAPPGDKYREYLLYDKYGELLEANTPGHYGLFVQGILERLARLRAKGDLAAPQSEFQKAVSEIFDRLVYEDLGATKISARAKLKNALQKQMRKKAPFWSAFAL